MSIQLDETADVSVVTQVTRLLGDIHIPADKSIAHRSALLASLGDGDSEILNYPRSADPQSTLACIRQLGVQMEEADGRLIVHGRGMEGLREPSEPLDCGNSGTTMRLLSGILAGQRFDTELIGDESLSVRPMTRIASPLREMGAEVSLTDGNAPVRIAGGRALHGITYRLPVASAQIKSCVLLAGLFAEGPTTVIETQPSRDHPERMLGLATFEMAGERHLAVSPGHRIPAATYEVPRDFSAAAFFLVAGALAGEGELRLPEVGLNPTRSALLDVLRAMGAEIYVSNEREQGGEPIGDLLVRPSKLNGISISGDLIPVLIDEIPVLAVAAAYIEGRTEIRGAAELRVKETDRIDVMVSNLRRMGAHVEEFDDGFALDGGGGLKGAEVESRGDHRIAMAMAVAGLFASGATIIRGASCAAVSFPGFWDALGRVASGD